MKNKENPIRHVDIRVDDQLLRKFRVVCKADDRSANKKLIALIRRMSEQGITILLIEHIMDLIKDVAENVYVLNYGAQIAQGTPDEIKRNPEVIAAYLGEED